MSSVLKDMRMEKVDLTTERVADMVDKVHEKKVGFNKHQFDAVQTHNRSVAVCSHTLARCLAAS